MASSGQQVLNHFGRQAVGRQVVAGRSANEPAAGGGFDSAAGSSRPSVSEESGTAGRVTLERVTGAQVEAVSNSIAQGGNPLYKSKMAPIASIFTEFDVKYGSEFASDDAAVARVSRESLPLVFDLLPPERATAMTVDELEDAALEVWARLETPTQRLAFLWDPHADAPRRYTGADVEPPGKKPLAVWEVPDGEGGGRASYSSGRQTRSSGGRPSPWSGSCPCRRSTS